MPGFGPTIPLTDFFREHRWEIIDLGLPVGSLASDASPDATVPSQTRQRAGASSFTLYAKSLQLPSLSFENEEFKAASHKYKFAKEASWEDVTVTFYDTYGLHQKLKTWQEGIWTPEEGIKPADNYKGSPVFALTDNQGNIQQKYTLVGAYPKKVSHGDLSYTSSEVKVLTVVYTYDWAEIEITDNANSVGTVARR